MRQEEVATIYQHNVEKIYRFFFYKVLDRETAEDLTSTTFLTFAKKITEEEVNSPQSYLYGIAKNVFLSFLKGKYKAHIEPLDNEEFEALVEETVERGADEKDIFDILEELLPKIPAKQREIISLRFVEKLTIEEICVKLNKDKNYVSTTQRRGLRALKRLLYSKRN